MPAFAVVVYTRLNSLAGRPVIRRQTVDTEKLLNVTRDELLVYRDIIAAERSSAFLADLTGISINRGRKTGKFVVHSIFSRILS